jgi:hypothetical protein
LAYYENTPRAKFALSAVSDVFKGIEFLKKSNMKLYTGPGRKTCNLFFAETFIFYIALCVFGEYSKRPYLD